VVEQRAENEDQNDRAGDGDGEQEPVPRPPVLFQQRRVCQRAEDKGAALVGETQQLIECPVGERYKVMPGPGPRCEKRDGEL